MAEELTLEQAWASLRVHVEWADAFWLVFVFTDDPRVARELAERTRAQVEGQGRRFVGLDPKPGEDLRAALADGEAGAVAWIDMVHGDARPDLPVWRSSWEQGLMRLNERREWLRRKWCGGGIVLATTRDRLEATPALAPDLWSIRAMVLRVEGIGFELQIEPSASSLIPPDRRVINPELQRQVVERARASGDDLSLVLGLSLLAQVSDRDEGLALAKEALALAGTLSNAVDLDSEGSLGMLDLLGSVFGLVGDVLGNRGDLDRGLEAYQRSVDVRRLLVQRNPRYLPQLGSSLVGLTYALANMRYFEVARDTAGQAVDIYRPLAGVDSEQFGVRLAGALNNVAAAESSLARHEDALAAIQEAIDILRALPEHNTEQVQPALAGSLVNLGVFSIRHGQLEQAIAAAREALAIYAELIEAQPERFAPAHAQALDWLVSWLTSSGRVEEALEILDLECARYGRLLGDGPRIAAALATALGASARLLLGLGRAGEARKNLVEALSHSPGAPELLEGYRRASDALGIDHGLDPDQS